MTKQLRTFEQIFEEIARVANIMPAPVYWLNTNGMVLGANDTLFKMVGGADKREEILKQTNHGFYPEDVAKTLIENNNKVIQLGETIEFEELIVDMITGEPKYITSIRSPIRDDEGNIIGIIGTSIDITHKKHAEELALQNEAQRVELALKEKYTALIDDVQNIMTKYRLDFLHQKLGSEPEAAITDEEKSAIQLSPREREVLFYLSHNKTPKEIAYILSTVEKKDVSSSTIHSIINRQLYMKFKVMSTSDLIEKASLYGMITFANT